MNNKINDTQKDDVKKSKSIKTPLKSAMMSKINKAEDVIEVRLKNNDYYIVPTYAHDGDVGLDVTATSVEYKSDIDTYVYHTGLYTESDKNIGCFLLPRSSNRKTDAYIPNAPGLADTFTYRGELCFSFKNRTDINVLSAIFALAKFNNLPWWKKLFTDYYKIWGDTYTELINDPMQFAPYEVGDKIGQLVFFRHPTVKFKVVDELSETERGEGGFGSTGK
jgi:dUTP pyrophosphatase